MRINPSRIVLAMLFFAWGLISVLIDMTIPVFKSVFDLGYREALIVQSAYFLAYLFLGRLSGAIVSRIGLRKGVLVGLSLMIVGTLSIIPATLLKQFLLILPAIFTIACGVTFLQVAANPLAAGFASSSKSSSQLTLVQGLNSLGTFAAPFLAGLLFFNVAGDAADGAAGLLGVRQVFFAITVMLIIITLLAAKVLTAPNSSNANTAAAKPDIIILDRPVPLLMGSAAIFFYVGAEVSISSVLINYLGDPKVLGLSASAAAGFAGLYWGGAMVARFLGSPLLSRFGGTRILAISTLAATFCALLSVVSHGVLAAIFVLLIGLFNGVQFPTIFALSISGRSVENRAKASGWLCTGIIGGGIVPLLFGTFADAASLKLAFILPALCYLYIFTFAMVAHQRLKGH